ncbi:MAG: hypothetical protein JWM47_2058 [Acidimicrobiales bacterium]|nr:hypothetical protein [Acidimicrobiales bacterium]
MEEMGPDLEGSASAIEKACRAYALEQQAGGKVTVPEVTPDETPKVPPSETPDGIDVNDEEGSPDTSTSVPSPNTGPEQQPANLPGLASTRGEWDGSHEATGEGEGNFGPVLADGSPRYTILATSEDGRVQSYFLNLPADTASGDVLEAVKAELPDDARPGEVITLEPGCQFHEWTSDVLKEATGRDVVANVGILFSTPDNPTGLVEVMISYEQPGSGFDC